METNLIFYTNEVIYDFIKGNSTLGESENLIFVNVALIHLDISTKDELF